jgi:hypothetical protein
MSYELTHQFTDSVGEAYEEEFEELEAKPFGEFARALFLGLGALLIIIASTFLFFSGIVAALMGLVP